MENIEQIVSQLLQGSATNVAASGGLLSANCAFTDGSSSGGNQNHSYTYVGPAALYGVPQYNWWPTYWSYGDSTQKAFRIVKVLMETKVVNLKEIADFVKLVDQIVEVL
jgi:hypothetical protein